ncbi:hypothetical protein B9479_003909 [Cryptococcus floricola]|uniref:Uncharacterized protein n=1 Tax=Cryptococcus floricola TaxID=2591691 RepID=A0A5D3AZU1_9TREE|nr:hypothetical protein B9479_003909 [Cryptococcus floricola]
MRSLFRPFPGPLTSRQWFYLSFLQGVGAGIIDGGANFGIAYAMYHGQDEIKMWVLAKNTIAGDLGVTPIIQCLASMLITSTLVHTDLHHHAVAPLPYVWPHVEHLPDPRRLIDKMFNKSSKVGEEKEDTEKRETPSPDSEEDEGRKGWAYYPKMLTRFIFEGTEANILLSPFSWKLFFIKVFLTAAQGAALGIVLGFPVWCLFIIVLGPLYGTDNMAAPHHWKWAPMVIKCVYGAVIGWITNPVIAAMALGSQAERHLLVVQHDQEASIGGDGIETIIEEDADLEPPQFPPSSPSSNHLAPPTPTSRSFTGRPRATSGASSMYSSRSRPPFIADCSDFPILPAPHYADGNMLAAPRSAPLLQSSRMRSLSQVTMQIGTPPRTAIPTLPASGPRETLLVPPSPSAGQTPSQLLFTPTQGRRRGLTTSTAHTAASGAGAGTVPGSPASGTWSYALGGTGGRAQRSKVRPRAVSSLSGKDRERAGGALWSGSRVAGVHLTPSMDMTSVRDQMGEQRESGVVASNEGGSKTPVWDVFGVVQGAEAEQKEDSPDSSK